MLFKCVYFADIRVGFHKKFFLSAFLIYYWKQ